MITLWRCNALRRTKNIMRQILSHLIHTFATKIIKNNVCKVRQMDYLCKPKN